MLRYAESVWRRPPTNKTGDYGGIVSFTGHFRRMGIGATLSSLLAILLVVAARDDCRVKVVIDSNDTYGARESDVDCKPLQEVLDRLSSTSNKNYSMDSAVIYLQSGYHYLTAPVNFTADFVTLIGVGKNVSVTCNYTTVPEDVTGGEYMWLFEEKSSVTLENLDFSHCPYPFRFVQAQNVNIFDCSFRYFQEAVLDLFNCVNLTLNGLLVEHNQGTGIVPLPYRGNTGAVAIGYNGLSPNLSATPTVSVSNSVFRNNSALATSRVISISATAFSQVFTGRGGALGVFVNESYHNMTIAIRNCSIVGNSARSFGGGAYVLLNGNTAQHVLLAEEVTLSSNTVILHGGGGMQLSFLSNGIPTAPHMAILTNCLFHNNTAQAGGGIYIFTSFLGSDGNYARLEGCVFSNNQGLGSENDYGAAIVITLLTIFRQRITVPRHEIVNCTFLRNRGLNGIVSIGYAPTTLRGNNQFIENEGASLRVVGAIVEVGGELSFKGNIVQDSAQLYILSFGQVRLQPGANVSFTNNKGRFGASIEVDSTQTLGTFTDLMFNPHCFILHHNFSIPPSQWTNVGITFVRNSATLASSIYVSLLDKCSWYGEEFRVFDSTAFSDWPLWTFIDETNTGFNESHDESFSIGTGVTEIHTEAAPVIAAWPGQRIRLRIQGIDKFGHPTTANIRFTFEAYPEISTLLKFTPQIVVIAPNSLDGLLHDQFILTYSLSEAVDSGGNQSLGEMSIQIPFATTTVASDRFVLNYTECPGGYVLERDSSTGLVKCECESTEVILHCEDDQDSVLIESGYWVSRSGPGSGLSFLPCPPGYCGCSQNTSLGASSCVTVYTNSNPDLQCVCERKGELCGECREGKGFSALLDNCVTCSNVSGLLILLLIVVDFAIFTGIMLLDRPLPSWIYPFLFYFQMVPYVSRYFMGNFDRIGQWEHIFRSTYRGVVIVALSIYHEISFVNYLKEAYYLGSGLGFYFIYDFCLYETMSPLVSYTLRFIPLLIALIVRPTLMTIRKLVRKCGKSMKSLQNHGGLLITLLLYTPTVHTSMSLLQCFPLTGRQSLVWYINGEIGCFTGGHTLVAYAAILVLLFCVLLIPLSLVLAVQEFSHKLNKMLRQNYKNEFKWWTAVELGRRFLFLLFFMPFPRSTVGPIVILVISISVYGFVKPYRERLANNLELVVQSLFLLLLILASVASTQDNLLTYPADGVSDSECGNRPNGVAGIAWTLLPFLYFPHFLLLIVGGSFLLHIVWIKYMHPRVIRSSTECRDPTEAIEFSHPVSPSTKTVVIIANETNIEGPATKGETFISSESHK